MFDANGSGTIDVGEFSQLFNYINQWKGRMLSVFTDTIIRNKKLF